MTMTKDEMSKKLEEFWGKMKSLSEMRRGFVFAGIYGRIESVIMTEAPVITPEYLERLEIEIDQELANEKAARDWRAYVTSDDFKARTPDQIFADSKAGKAAARIKND